MSLTAQTYIVSEFSDAFHISHLFVRLHDELERVDSIFAPAFVERDIFLESVRKKWYKPGNIELTISNRKIFNLEFIRETFSRHKTLVLDIGTDISSLVYYRDGSFALKEEKVGLANGLTPLLHSPAERERLYSFLHLELDRREVFDFLADRQLYPSRLASSLNERLIELAATTSIIQRLRAEHSRYFMVTPPHDERRPSKSASIGSHMGVAILTGEGFWFDIPETESLSHLEGLALLAFLDGADIEGIWRVYLDGKNLTAPLGRLKKEGVVSVPVTHYINQLGTVIVLSHNLADGTPLGTLKFDLGFHSPQELHVVSGQILRLPFERGQTGKLEMALQDGVHISGLEESHIPPHLEIEGGSLGIIIDARGRPLQSRLTNKGIRQRWLEGIGLQLAEV
jgi:hypothetical protein